MTVLFHCAQSSQIHIILFTMENILSVAVTRTFHLPNKLTMHNLSSEIFHKGSEVYLYMR